MVATITTADLGVLPYRLDYSPRYVNKVNSSTISCFIFIFGDDACIALLDFSQIFYRNIVTSIYGNRGAVQIYSTNSVPSEPAIYYSGLMKLITKVLLLSITSICT